MKENDQLYMVEVFAGNSWEAGLVKSLLLNAGIECYLKDHIRGTLEPWDVAAGGSNAVKVMVLDKNIEKAKPILDQFWENRFD